MAKIELREKNIALDYCRDAVFAPSSTGIHKHATQINTSSKSLIELSYEQIYSLSLLSHLSYFSKTKLENEAAKLHFEILNIFYHNNEMAYLCRRKKVENEFILVCQGSTGGRDTWLDAKFFPIANDDEKSHSVHRGFREAWHAVRELVLKETKGIKAEQIIVTGHSLGAAIAQLAAIDLNTSHCTVFGSPRLFHRKTPAISENYLQINLDPDIVSSMPMSFLGYRDHGKYIKLVCENSDSYLQHLYQAHKQAKHRANLMRSITAHAPINYSEFLYQAWQNSPNEEKLLALNKV